jgi:hypothetical protein
MLTQPERFREDQNAGTASGRRLKKSWLRIVRPSA